MNAALLAEHRAAHEHAVVSTRNDRALVRMYGRDPQRILQGIVTNDVANAPAGQAVYAALLTAKGRMVTDMRILREDGEFLLDVPAAALSALLDSFRRTVPPLFARYEDVSAARSVLGVYGPEATSQLTALLGSDVPTAAEDAHASLPREDGSVHVVATHYAGVDGYDIIAATDAIDDLRGALRARGLNELSAAALEVLRVEAGSPRWGAELTENTIPLEAGLERAISTSKGCYTGQEVIIRILHRGHVNWHLRGVLLGERVPAAEAQLVQPESGKAVGRITSAVWSAKHDRAIALAYVRREIEPGSTLSLGEQGGEAVEVVALPFAS